METKLLELVTGTEMKPWLSRNMLPNINTCENGWSNFSANHRVLSLKLLELTQFPCPNYQFTLISYVPSLAMRSSRVLVFWDEDTYHSQHCQLPFRADCSERHYQKRRTCDGSTVYLNELKPWGGKITEHFHIFQTCRYESEFCFYSDSLKFQ